MGKLNKSASSDGSQKTFFLPHFSFYATADFFIFDILRLTNLLSGNDDFLDAVDRFYPIVQVEKA
ncbi:hypothetical protein SAMN05421747_10346 [Parapedobacter composti]|uniref:Uncharacterized protein n=1 Tax=Parapedobacter composti TaxID=623281 RepID=A0A1I1FM91_9SPHI|nr:hypothetical protein SAMN05421747_10346 [Parapedobacter composti]